MDFSLKSGLNMWRFRKKGWLYNKSFVNNPTG